MREKVIEKITTIHKSEIYNEISVKYGIVTVNGSVRTFLEKRIVAEGIWHIIGVLKVLSLLKVSDPMTAGPRILVADSSNSLAENDGNRQ